MALTFTESSPHGSAITVGPYRAWIGRITFDASYASGGEPFVPSDVGLSEFLAVFLSTYESTGYVAQYDASLGDIVLYEAGADAAALDEVTATTDVSAVVLSALCIEA